MKHIASGVAATPLAALSLLAVVVGVAGVGPQSLAYAGVSSSTSQDDQHGARLALDGNDAMSTDGVARHFSSGPAKNYPWLAADLGGRSKVTSVRVFGHSTNNNCMLLMLTGTASADCSDAVDPTRVYVGPSEGVVVGVSDTPCPPASTAGTVVEGGAMCGGTICAAIHKSADLGYTATLPPSDFTVVW